MTVTFVSNLQNGSIVLNDATPVIIEKNISVDAGNTNITVDANQTSGVFSISAEATATLTGLTITGGKEGIGAGIFHMDGLSNCDRQYDYREFG